MRCTAVLIRTADGVAPRIGEPVGLAVADAAESKDFFPVPYDLGYHTAMETRHVSGTWGHGAMAVWLGNNATIEPLNVRVSELQVSNRRKKFSRPPLKSAP